MNKLLILGGTFDPIHNGHIKMLESFYDFIKPDKALLVPTNIPVHKEYKSNATAQDRLNMCKLAVEDFENVYVSDIEIKRKGRSYTIDTLRDLKLIYPEFDMFFLTGADMFMTLQHWKSPKEILNLCTLCSLPRDGVNINKLKNQEKFLKKICPDSKFVILEVDEVDISSTQIRSLVESSLNVSDLVPKKVLSYIKENKLYS